MSSLASTAGELLIDHSNSPGIPDDLAAKWSAMGVTVARAGEKVEVPAYCCKHCQAVVILNPNRTRERNVCRKCMAIVCDKPTCVLECQPFEMIAERVLSGRRVAFDPNTNLLLPT